MIPPGGPEGESADAQRVSMAAAGLDELGRARRRLAAWLLGSPWAGAALAATAANAPTAPTDGAAFTGRWVHGFAAYGPPKYGPDFKHFDYVNPDAPRGGRIRLPGPDRRTSFDKFNPWSDRTHI